MHYVDFVRRPVSLYSGLIAAESAAATTGAESARALAVSANQIKLACSSLIRPGAARPSSKCTVHETNTFTAFILQLVRYRAAPNLVPLV